MTEWRTWDLRAWNERLLNHFFHCKEEIASPVVVLLVTADELARTTGDESAKASEVRDAFVQAVRSGISRHRSLLDDASDYRGWRPRSAALPRFVAHLLFTCVAASESSDELADEGSFVARLRDLTQDRLPDNSLQSLSRLWEDLATWLRTNNRRFRPLILPDPGGLTRIGYTVKLAFPDRRDQRQLSELLDRAGLAGHEPPVGRVLSIVGSERSHFRNAFLLAFDEFRRLFESSGGRPTPRLVEHRVWAAVREASLRGRGQVGLSDAAVRLSLLGEEEEDRLALFAAADERTECAAVWFAEMPVHYGPWRFALLPRGAETLDADQLKRIVRALLDGSLRLPGVSSHVDQGLLPFVTASHGLLELAGQEQLGDVSVALARKEIAPDLLRIMGSRESTPRPSLYDGWVQVRVAGLRVLSSAELEDTSLYRTWILHQSLNRASSRLVGGVRADDGWLGVREVLPRVIAPGASAVVLEGPDGELALNSLDNDAWSLPPGDIAGDYTIVVSVDGREDRRPIRFHTTPASETFKLASAPDAWIVEQVDGTGTLSTSTPFAAKYCDYDCAPLCERAAFLGPDVGVFVPSADLAAWEIEHFAGRFVGARGSVRGDDAIPRHQVASANARRRWRKMLFESVASSSDPMFDEARRPVRAGASTQVHLPRVELPQSVPDLAPPRLASPSEATDRLVRIVAGRAAARSGIDWREWSELTRRVLDLDGTLLQRVTRAWMEAGLIDVASSSRWWHRAIFARRPRLIAFRVGQHFGASLSGLALPATVEEVRRSATRVGMLVEDRLSVSPFVPRTISLRARDRQAIEDLCAAGQLELQWLEMTRLGVASSRHDGTSAPPEHYERSSLWSRWSLNNAEYPQVAVEHRMRRDRPDFWIVSRAEWRTWFYDLNLARAWAAALLGEPMVRPNGDGFLEANHAFLPLPIARVVTILGSGLSGPTDSITYRYPIGRRRLCDAILDVVSRTFDPSRLVVTAPEQTTG